MTWNVATFSAINGLAAHTAWLNPVIAASPSGPARSCSC